MLGQPVSMLIPRVVGFELSGELPEGSTATDLVLTITEMLRKHGVVGKFVEFYGEGVGALPLANRATIGNMSPEFGSTIAVFPIDQQTIEYLRLTGRGDEQLALVEAYAKEQGLWHDPTARGTSSRATPRSSSSTSGRSCRPWPDPSGPRTGSRSPRRSRPSGPRWPTTSTRGTRTTAWSRRRTRPSAESFPASDAPAYSADTNGGGEPTDWHLNRASAKGRPSSPTQVELSDGTKFEIDHGAVTIAAITSCTNTSNPSVMIGAALLAKNAVEKGLQRKPWVKTTLAPGSKVVSDYYERSGLTPYLDKLGFNLVGYGCTTCIGNSGPLIPEVSEAVQEKDLAVVSVLSGNRNFEGRINPDVKMNYLASPPLVVAYALAGSMDVDLFDDPLGQDSDGNDVYLKDIWPSPPRSSEVIGESISADMFGSSYEDVFAGDERWRIAVRRPRATPSSGTRTRPTSGGPPYFDGMPEEPEDVTDIEGARVLLKLGDSVTTDHISPAGAIKKDSPAGKYLADHGVEQRDFNSYGSRRGNHEVMIRGTFANIRLRNQLAPGTEGGVTRDFTADGNETTVFEASENYLKEGIPLVVLAGKEYGSGSSRDWAAKGTALLGRQGRDRRVLRADPPVQPDRHGRAAAAVPRGRERRVAGADRRGDVHDHRCHRAQRRQDPEDRQGQGRRHRVRRRRTDRHPRRGELLPQRRDHAVRPAQPAQGLSHRREP